MSSLRFLFDRCCPVRLARVIAAFDEVKTVRFVDDDERFERTTPDVEWIRMLAADLPWAVVSMDAKVLTRPHEINALRGSGVKFVLLGKGWMRMPPHQQAWRLLKTWPNVVEAVRNVRADLFEVSAGGSHKVEPIRR